jgi:DNA-binding winged helix-turn-helix (wHTH) protein/tetratricopeptide (TPR) repeat protein
MTTAAKRCFEFGAFRLDTGERLLLHQGETVSLTPKAFDMLVTLVENSGHLVEKSELMRKLWPDSFVEEGSLAQNVSLLRKALGENETEKFIETVPRRGYRFVATVVSKSTRVIDATIQSIAVLPFKSLGVEGGDEYLSVGIAETLTTRLSSLKLLTVRPTSAVLKYARSEKDALETGQELQVDTILEGSIRRAGERLRVTARLVSVCDQAVLWADKFDEQFTDIFAVEDSISAKVTQALALKVSGEEQKRLTRRYTNNAEAYQLYLKGRYFWNKRTEEGFEQGITHFTQAVAKDATYALAYAGLADSYIGLTFYNFGAPHDAMPKAKEAAMNALAIDSALAEAHTSLAHILMNYDWNWSEAEKEFKLSMQLNPSYATAHQWYAIHYLTAMDRLEEALEEMTQALQLEPASLVMNSFMGATLYFARRYDEAVEQCRRTIEMDPHFAVAHWHIGLAYEQKGMFDEAIAQFQTATQLSGGSPLIKACLGHAYAKANRRNDVTKILAELNELSRERYISSYERAAISVALGKKEESFQWLERAYEEHSFHMVYLKVWPQFSAIRSDARFQNLIQRLGLPRTSAHDSLAAV